MTKDEALKMIDNHKNRMVDPVDMLRWTILRVILLKISQEAWDDAVIAAKETLSR